MMKAAPHAGEGRSYPRGGDYRTILSGTAQNVVGIGVAAAALLVIQVLMTRTLGSAGYGVVTVLTQAAFVASFATRAGMDMAVLRDVAVDAGMGEWRRIRGTVARATWIALAVSAAIAVLLVVFAEPISRVFNVDRDAHRWAVEVAAAGLPFLAVTNVWLAATRGLKIMRYTLYIFWAGQNLLWILLTLLLWTFSTTATASIAAYSLSWAAAAGAAWIAWRRESRTWEIAPPEVGWLSKLARYAGPRAPAALFAQLLFWTDLFVLTYFVNQSEVGVYSAALRAGQVVMLFLTSVNLMFGPYVADLYNRGEHERLDDLYKTLTRWLVAATLPVFALIAIAPDAVMSLFGSEFAEAGRTALLILLAGQLANVVTGSAGFILIMVGRTGWDLLVYVSSLVLDVVLAIWLCSRYGIEGAALANAITFTVSNLFRLTLVHRFVRIQPYDARYLRLLAPGAAAAGAMWAAQRLLDARSPLDLAILGILGGLVYVGAYLVAGLTPQERTSLNNLWTKVRSREGPSGV